MQGKPNRGQGSADSDALPSIPSTGRVVQAPMEVEHPLESADHSDIARFLYRPILFEEPEYVDESSAWLGHLSFALWIVDAIRPRIFVELGTHGGVSYCAFCQAIRRLDISAVAFAVDTWEGDEHSGGYGQRVWNELHAYHDPLYGHFSQLMRTTFDDAVTYFTDGTIDLLHIDGYHTYDAVRHDFETWLPKMSERGVVLFHDTNVRERGFGVWRFWEEVSARYPAFAFHHGHGLGVLAVGREISPQVRWLMGQGSENGTFDPSSVRAFFNQRAATVRHRLEGQLLRKEIQRLSTVIAERDQQLAQQTERMSCLEMHGVDKDRHITNLDSQIAQNDQSIADKNRHIDNLRSLLDERTQRLIDLFADSPAKQRQLETLTELLASEKERLKEASQEIHRLSAAMQHERTIVAEMRSSASWRLSAPLRLCGRLARALAHPRIPRTHRMTLVPLQQLAGLSATTFESKGIDPQFQLVSNRRHCPRGLVDIDFDVVASDPYLEPALYVVGADNPDLASRVNLPACRSGHVQVTVKLPERVTALRFDPLERPGTFAVENFTIREVHRAVRMLRTAWRNPHLLVRSVDYVRRHGMRSAWSRAHNALGTTPQPGDYERWVELNDTLNPVMLSRLEAHQRSLSYRPLVSVVMPVFDPPIDFLRRCLDSVLAQTYGRWELCIADDASRNEEVRMLLGEFAARDSRVRVTYREENGHIAVASNSALALAEGEFIALLDHDDELPKHALYSVVAELNRHPDADLMYSDEDKIDAEGKRYGPYFKPDWNPELFLTQNIVNHLGVYRTELVRSLGGFRAGFEGSQDYDLALRVVAASKPERIRHIPFVLYHWRVYEDSGAFSTQSLPTATKAARRAIVEYCASQGEQVRVENADVGAYHRIVRRLPDDLPQVSLIIPTRDRVELLRRCVDGLLNETDYPHLELVIVDNDSRDTETLDYLDTLSRNSKARIVPFQGDFNFSAINNEAVRVANGSVLGFVNNDIQVKDPQWLREMLVYAIRPQVGGVGAKLIYGNDTVQHGGVILGIGGVAGHAHKHYPANADGYFGRLKLPQNLSAVTAACMLMRRDAFDAVGGFDQDNLPVAFNDVDFCLRLREAGFEIIWTPYAELYHLESVSRGLDTDPSRVGRFMREVAYMKRRWGGILLDDPAYSPNLSLVSEDFALAFPPRCRRPWEDFQESSDSAEQQQAAAL